MVEYAKVTLVTVIAVAELEERLIRDLTGMGVKGYTIGKADGRGVHGPRTAGLVDAPNLRIEMLVDGLLAERIVEQIVSEYAEQPILAYAHEVRAVPRDHFG